ncbi:MAG TPA: SDR family NAD(P)-dependent oxidoreductase [Paracoccaceae bacterium]|nr:SDR family NAD(P)-dependent oxidoreductase [Paracoccaceae bacterium]
MDGALVIGSSGGIGAALAGALAARGAEVTGLSRRAHGLDVTDEASVADALGQLAPPFHRVIVATGALAPPGLGPEKTLRAVDPGQVAAQFALNALGPLLVLRHALRLMPRDAPCIFAALSARVGSIGDNRLGGWYSYRASKAALNQFLRTAAVEVARTHPQAVVASLHPGTVATGFGTAFHAGRDTLSPDVAAAHLLAVMDRLTPDDTGGFFDWQGQAVPW